MILYRYLTGPDDAKFCHRVTAALNKGWSLAGSPTLTFNAATGQVVAGQAITKTVEGTYTPDMDMSAF